MTIKRKTAEAYLQQLPALAAAINTRAFAWRIARLEVFGSYLSDKELLGDLDILVTMRPRSADPKEQEALNTVRRREARRTGRNFNTFLDELVWPQEEVWRALRDRKYSISLHPADEKPHLTGPFQLIWEEEADDHN